MRGGRRRGEKRGIRLLSFNADRAQKTRKKTEERKKERRNLSALFYPSCISLLAFAITRGKAKQEKKK